MGRRWRQHAGGGGTSHLARTDWLLYSEVQCRQDVETIYLNIFNQPIQACAVVLLCLSAAALRVFLQVVF